MSNAFLTEFSFFAESKNQFGIDDSFEDYQNQFFRGKCEVTKKLPEAFFRFLYESLTFPNDCCEYIEGTKGFYSVPNESPLFQLYRNLDIREFVYRYTSLDSRRFDEHKFSIKENEFDVTRFCRMVCYFEDMANFDLAMSSVRVELQYNKTFPMHTVRASHEWPSHRVELNFYESLKPKR